MRGTRPRVTKNLSLLEDKIRLLAKAVSDSVANCRRLQMLLVRNENGCIGATLQPGISPLQLAENKAPRGAVVEQM